MKRRVFLGLSLAATAVAVAGCNANTRVPSASGSASDGFTLVTPEKGGTLYILTAAKEIHFDPAMSQNLATSAIHYIVRGLTSWKTDPKADTKLVADLATDTGTTTDGGKTWKYTLRDGLKYADGSPIISADIKFGLERSFDAQLQGGLSYHKVLLVGGHNYTGPSAGKHLDSIETPDDKTIIFHLTKPFNDWPWITSMPAFAPIPATKGMGIPAYDHTPPSSGPYQISDYQVGAKITLERNPSWSSDVDAVRPAYPDTIIYEMGLNADTAAQRMAADFGDDKNATGPAVTASLVAKINADPTLKRRVYVSPSGAITYLVMNVTRPGLKDIAVRQAINYAINKQQIQTLAGGPIYGGDIATTLLPPGVNGYHDFDLYPAAPTGDPEKAKELLSGKTVPTLKLVIDASSALGTMAASVQNDLNAVGLDVQIVSQDSDSAVNSLRKTGDFDLGFGSWQADYPSAYAALQPLVAATEIGNGNYNMSWLNDPAIDNAITAAVGESDATKATSAWGALDEQIMKLAPLVPLLYAKTGFMYGSNVGGSYVPSFPSYTNALLQGLKQP